MMNVSHMSPVNSSVLQQHVLSHVLVFTCHRTWLQRSCYWF